MSKRILWLIIFILFLIVGYLIYDNYSESTEKEDFSSKEVMQSEQGEKSYNDFTIIDTRELVLTNFDTIQVKLSAQKIQKLTFEVSGILEKGDIELKQGNSFKFNDLLVKLNMRETYLKLNQLKAELKNAFGNALPDLEKHFPERVKRWTDYANTISYSNRLKEMPNASVAEFDILEKHNVLTIYNRVFNQEQEIDKYFFLAPYDGKITKVLLNPGVQINKGTVVAEFVESGKRSLVGSTAIPVDKIPANCKLLDTKGKQIGTVTAPRKIKTNGNETQISFKYLLNDKTVLKEGLTYMVQIPIKQNVRAIPRKAINGNSVLIWDSQALKKEVRIIKDNGDTVFVVGLTSDEKVIVQ